jgi:hypothetical protein
VTPAYALWTSPLTFLPCPRLSPRTGYVWSTLGTDHYTAPTSSSSISRALAACIPTSRIHLGATISSLCRNLDTATTSITFSSTTEGQTSFTTLDGFDEVIFATQANQAKRLLDTLLDGLDSASGPAKELGEASEALGKFRYVVSLSLSPSSSLALPI